MRTSTDRQKGQGNVSVDQVHVSSYLLFDNDKKCYFLIRKCVFLEILTGLKMTPLQLFSVLRYFWAAALLVNFIYCRSLYKTLELD